MHSLVTCPHCGTRVAPSGSGLCPACQGDTSSPTTSPDSPRCDSTTASPDRQRFDSTTAAPVSQPLTPSSAKGFPAWVALIAGPIVCLVLFARGARRNGGEFDPLLLAAAAGIGLIAGIAIFAYDIYRKKR